MSEFPRRLPGDPSPREQVERMIRVDHAGEYGAKRIYDGQLAVLGRAKSAPEIRRMAEQEQRHLAAFDKLIAEHRVRPTLLSPLWHAAGFALGAASALMGERAAMACTVAVEEVIDEHYRRQSETLGDAEPALKAAIDEFRRDEQRASRYRACPWRGASAALSRAHRRHQSRLAPRDLALDADLARASNRHR